MPRTRTGGSNPPVPRGGRERRLRVRSAAIRWLLLSIEVPRWLLDSSRQLVRDLEEQRVALPALDLVRPGSTELAAEHQMFVGRWQQARQVLRTLALELPWHVRWTVLKGAAVEATYGGRMRRQVGDVDLGVSGDDASVVGMTLRRMGYRPIPVALLGRTPSGLECRVEKWIGASLASDFVIELCVAGFPAARTLWHAFTPEFWQQRAALAIDGQRVPVPALHDQYLIHLRECGDRSELTARDVIDFVALRRVVRSVPALSYAERFTQAALAREASASLADAHTRNPLSSAASRWPWVSAGLAASTLGPESLWWEIVCRYAAKSVNERARTAFAQIYPLALGTRVLARRRAAIALAQCWDARPVSRAWNYVIAPLPIVREDEARQFRVDVSGDHA